MSWDQFLSVMTMALMMIIALPYGGFSRNLWPGKGSFHNPSLWQHLEAATGGFLPSPKRLRFGSYHQQPLYAESFGFWRRPRCRSFGNTYIHGRRSNRFVAEGVRAP
jgi:hypothetical protein